MDLMQDPRLVPEAENRLATFNDERSSIVDQVVRRVVGRKLALAEKRPEHSLEYVLNEVAFAEIKRHEKSGGKDQKKKLARWRDLAHSLGRMSEGERRKELEGLVRYHAQDIAGNFNPKVYRFARDILPPAFSFLLNPISGVKDGMEALGSLKEQIRIEGPIDVVRTCCERGTLVVTPTHSSNLDSIAIGFGLQRAKLPPVTYGVGKNLFTNPFMTFFMHNLGAYRVDRRLRFSLYKDVLKEYSTVLLERGYHSLFFPGGTRCRSNDVEQHLKLGLMGTTMTAYVNNLRDEGPPRRLYIVPVTINYRLVLEAESLIDDYLSETGKSRYIIEDDEFSKLHRIVDFARKILAHEGAVTLKFGRPLDPFGNEVDDAGESRDARGRLVDPASFVQDAQGEVVEDPQRDSVYTRRLGLKVAEAYRRDTVFMGSNVVARAAYEVAKERTGIADIYRLMRLPDSALAIPFDQLSEQVVRVRAAIDAHPEWGQLDSRSCELGAEELILETLRFFRSYHTKKVLYKVGDHVRVGSMKLVYYYKRRTSHVELESGGQR